MGTDRVFILKLEIVIVRDVVPSRGVDSNLPGLGLHGEHVLLLPQLLLPPHLQLGGPAQSTGHLAQQRVLYVPHPVAGLSPGGTKIICRVLHQLQTSYQTAEAPAPLRTWKP